MQHNIQIIYAGERMSLGEIGEKVRTSNYVKVEPISLTGIINNAGN